MKTVSLEDHIAGLNKAYLFREFTYSNSKFKKRHKPDGVGQDEVELADSLLWLGTNLVVYQLKEREAPRKTTPAQERSWFERKVLGKGTKQVRDTLRYLESEDRICLENHRGHQFDLEPGSIANIHKLIVFKPDPALPWDLATKKFHESTTAGIMHLIHADDYLGILRTLLIPADFMDYLAYREKLIRQWAAYVDDLPEQALLGHYLGEGLDTVPKPSHAQHLAMLQHRVEEWDVSGIIALYAERIIATRGPTDYYAIVMTLAQMRRDELREFKRRYLLALQKTRANEFDRPYRVAYPRINCGFVFIPLTDDLIPSRRYALLSFTMAHKYDQRLQRCIGMTFAADGGEHYTVEWCLMDYAWEQDEELDRALANSNPFRDVRSVPSERYLRHLDRQ